MTRSRKTQALKSALIALALVFGIEILSNFDSTATLLVAVLFIFATLGFALHAAFCLMSETDSQ